MARIAPFEEFPELYEAWFERFPYVYKSELNAVKELIPSFGDGLEIGVGSGRFAWPLGIRYGVEPSEKLRRIAGGRGVIAASAIGEELPYRGECFDLVLMVTTICFLDRVEDAFREAYRVLRPGGFFVLGFVDRNSLLGRQYENNREKSHFYQIATFYSVDETCGLLDSAGFTGFSFAQTIFTSLQKISAVEPVRNGHGQGSFVVIRTRKPVPR